MPRCLKPWFDWMRLPTTVPGPTNIWWCISSMGFGNPYMDEWSEEMVLEWSLDLVEVLPFCFVSCGHGWLGV